MDSVDRGKQLLNLTIDLGNGKNDFIAVHEYDDPDFLAQEFCEKYALDSKLRKNLELMIKENVKEVRQNNLTQTEGLNSEDLYKSPFLSPIKSEVQHSQKSSINRPASQSSKNPSKAAKTSNRGKETVFSSVYKELRKSEASKSVSVMSSRTIKKEGHNYGDYLYAKGIKDKEQSEKFKEMKKQELFEKQIQNYTFSPLINNNSSIISPRVYDKPENILMKKQQEKEEKIKALKEIHDKEALRECSFVPKINIKSQSYDRFGKIHDELYTQAKQMRIKRSQDIVKDSKKWSFAPDVGSAVKKNSSETTNQFLNRLESSKRQSDQQLDQIRTQKEMYELSQCEQYKSNSTKNILRYTSEPIWEYLYNQKDSKKKDIQVSQKEFLKSVAEASTCKKTSDTSDKIFKNFRKAQFERLFILMDSDFDGQISVEAIEINGIETAVLKVLTPFFEELEHSERIIEIEEFVGIMEEFYQRLSMEQRGLLIKRPENKKEDDVERVPFVSPTSRSLAEKANRMLPTDFFERQNTVTRMKEMKVQMKRGEIQAKSMTECRFKPVI